jgi:hypothetical protein
VSSAIPSPPSARLNIKNKKQNKNNSPSSLSKTNFTYYVGEELNSAGWPGLLFDPDPDPDLGELPRYPGIQVLSSESSALRIKGKVGDAGARTQSLHPESHCCVERIMMNDRKPTRLNSFRGHVPSG